MPSSFSPPGCVMSAVVAEVPVQFALPEGRRDQNKLAKRLRRQVGQAIMAYNMIRDSDKVMVALSGGKDSDIKLDMRVQLTAKIGRAPWRERVCQNVEKLVGPDTNKKNKK